MGGRDQQDRSKGAWDDEREFRGRRRVWEHEDGKEKAGVGTVVNTILTDSLRLTFYKKFFFIE